MIEHKNTLVKGNDIHVPNLYDVVDNLELEVKLIRAIISASKNDYTVTVSAISAEMVRIFNIKLGIQRISRTLVQLREKGYLD